MTGIDVKARVVIPPRFKALVDGFSNNKILKFAQKDLNRTGELATAELVKMLQEKIYSHGTAVLEGNNKVRQAHTGQFLKAARFIKSDRVATTARGVGINAGIFDLKEAKKMVAHKKGLRYYEILEHGHQPYILTRKQKRNYIIMLKVMKKYDPAVLKQFGGIRAKGGSLGGVHPGIEPMRFFYRAMWHWYDNASPLINNVVNRYLDSVTPGYKPEVIESVGLRGMPTGKVIYPRIMFTIR